CLRRARALRRFAQLHAHQALRARRRRRARCREGEGGPFATEPRIVTALPVPGAVLRLVTVGPTAGRSLLVLHGGPGASPTALPPSLSRLASAARRVVYYDQRGGGGSALAEGSPPVGWEGHCADVESVRRHLDVEQLDLLGFSWGALLAL